MHSYAETNKINKKAWEKTSFLDRYCSVEIANSSIDPSYRFKLWNIASSSICILVKENSQILSRLKKGDTLNMKYYAKNSLFPAENRETTIRNIKKNKNGRFKGHYLVDLEILDNQNAENVHLA